MKKWKKIVLGVFGGLVIGGLCYLHTVTTPADAQTTLRRGPSGNSLQERVAIALRDTVNTDGSHVSITNYGALTAGVGTKSGGWVVADAAETTTGANTEGTLTTFALPGSSTCQVVADVIGRAATDTAVIRATVSGTFDRNGTGAMTNFGTDTVTSDVSEGLTFGDTSAYIHWVAGDASNHSVQLVGKGTHTKMQWIAHVRSLTVTTDGTE